VYSSKLGQPSSTCKLAAVNGLCLTCIQSIFASRYDTVPEIGDVFFTKELEVEWSNFYADFYTEEEQEGEMDQWETDEETFLCYDRSMQRIMPWLAKRGVRRTCPHVPGACRDIDCCRGTEAVPVLEEEVIEEKIPNAPRLFIGKRKEEKVQQGKGGV
jgi:hypothetical protein